VRVRPGTRFVLFWKCLTPCKSESWLSTLAITTHVLYFILWRQALTIAGRCTCGAALPPYLACGGPAVIVWVIVNEFKTTWNNIEQGADKPKADKKYWKQTEGIGQGRGQGRAKITQKGWGKDEGGKPRRSRSRSRTPNCIASSPHRGRGRSRTPNCIYSNIPGPLKAYRQRG